MRCGKCRAEVMLGSAQCQRCGASLLEGLEDQLPPRRFGDAPENVAMAPPVASSGTWTGDARVDAPPPPPPPPPSPPLVTGFPPPPPPGAPPRPPTGRRPGQAAGPMVGEGRSKAKARSGCGCLVPVLVLFFIGPIVGGIVAVARAAFDSVADDGETIDQGTLVVGVPRSATLAEGDTHRYVLAGFPGPARFSVDGGDGFDAEVRVTDEAGDELGFDDDGGEGLDSQLDVDLEVGRTYLVDVSEHNDDAAGAYVVRVAPLRRDGGPLSAGQPVAGDVDEDEIVAYTYVGEGREVVIGVAGNGFDSTLRARDAAGNELLSNDDTNGLDPELRLVVAPGDRITVEVAGLSGRAGSYTVLLR